MLAYLIGTPFKKNIRYLRRKRKISQKEMAKKMDMSLYYYVKHFESEIESGTAMFDSDELRLLCYHLFVTPTSLIELDQEELDRSMVQEQEPDWDALYQRIIEDCMDPKLR